jgi:hypothetical protein
MLLERGTDFRAGAVQQHTLIRLGNAEHVAHFL